MVIQLSKLESTLKALKRFAKKQGYWPSITKWDDYARSNNYYTQQGLYYHGRKPWEIMRKEMGFAERNRRYTKEECIHALQEASEIYGHTIKRREYAEWRKENQGKPSPAQIALLFHSFNNAKADAGLIPNSVFGKVFTHEEIIDAIRKCSADLGELFSETDYEKWRNGNRNIPTIETIRKRIGSLVEAKRRMGLDSYEAGTQYKYTEERWKIPFMDFLRDVLSSDNYKKWAKENDAPSMRALFDNVSGYTNALKEMLPLYIQDKLSD